MLDAHYDEPTGSVDSEDVSEESLKEIFDQAMVMLKKVESGKEPTNSDPVQMTIKQAITKFEKCTNLVSLSHMFSTNEALDELPTETLQYLLLPALLGTLTLKICGRQRADIIHVAEIYFKDFLKWCKLYGLIDEEACNWERDAHTPKLHTEQAKIANMVLNREAKIKRYKAAKELKEKLETLQKALNSASTDESTKREYALTLLQDYINVALDELASIKQEKPILEYMAKHGEYKPREETRVAPLKPVIITRDAIQKKIYGLGYPSLPTMTIEEFYDNRVKEGLFPGSCTSIPHATIQTTEQDPAEQEEIQKEELVENDDPQNLEQQRNFDEYKDDHRRGWGNRHNRS